MATNEDNDEAEQLRFLALKSIVRRSKPNNSNNDADDQDIKLLRAAALKTITHKSNAQNNSLVNKSEELVKSNIVNEKKRIISSQLSSLRKKKYVKLNENKAIESKDFMTYNNNTRKSSELLKYDQKQEYMRKHKIENSESPKPKTEHNIKSQSKPHVNDSKDIVKKIVRNGCMQLSNLDSENIDETMVLHITFSSTESSDDSSSECDIIRKEVVAQKSECNNVKNNVLKQLVPVKQTVNVESANSVPFEDNKLRMNDCLKNLCGLMRNCEAEIAKRNQQVEILLDAYEKYQSYNRSLNSILQMMKTTRDELSVYQSLEANAINN